MLSRAVCDASAGNRTRGWPNHMRSDDLEWQRPILPLNHQCLMKVDWRCCLYRMIGRGARDFGSKTDQNRPRCEGESKRTRLFGDKRTCFQCCQKRSLYFVAGRKALVEREKKVSFCYSPTMLAGKNKNLVQRKGKNVPIEIESPGNSHAPTKKQCLITNRTENRRKIPNSVGESRLRARSRCRPV
jgi:hypothetical protein